MSDGTIQAARKQRRDREAQQRHRGSKRSYVTEIENLQVLIARVAGELSEGQAARALGVDRVTERVMELDAVKVGVALCDVMSARRRQELLDNPPFSCEVDGED